MIEPSRLASGAALGWRWWLLGAIGAGVACGGSVRKGVDADCQGEVRLEGGQRRCADGVLHRVKVGSCSVLLPLPDPFSELQLAESVSSACRRNADCTDRPYGQCKATSQHTYCSYGCASDSDCQPSELCSCQEGSAGSCVEAVCHEDSECGGHLCLSNTQCGSTQFTCTTDADQCISDADCPSGTACWLVDSSDFNPERTAPGQYRTCRVMGCPIP